MNIHCKHNFPIFAEAFLPDGLPRKCTMRIIEPIMISQMVAKVYEVILEVNCSNKVKDHVGFKCTFLYVARWMKQRPLRNIFGLFCGFLQNIWYCTKKETTKKDTFASFKRPQCPMKGRCPNTPGTFNSLLTNGWQDQAIAIFRAPRPRPHGPRPCHPYHRQIKAIISRHRRCFPCIGDLSILDWTMIGIFWRQKL